MSRFYKFPKKDILNVFSHHTFSSQVHRIDKKKNKKMYNGYRPHTYQKQGEHQYISFEHFKKKGKGID